MASVGAKTSLIFFSRERIEYPEYIQIYALYFEIRACGFEANRLKMHQARVKNYWQSVKGAETSLAARYPALETWSTSQGQAIAVFGRGGICRPSRSSCSSPLEGDPF
jgi:hypothetical protein